MVQEHFRLFNRRTAGHYQRLIERKLAQSSRALALNQSIKVISSMSGLVAEDYC